MKIGPLGDDVSLTLEQQPISNESAKLNADEWFPGFTSFLPDKSSLGDGANIHISWHKPSDTAYRTSNIGLSADGKWFSKDVDGQQHVQYLEWQRPRLNPTSRKNLKIDLWH